MENLAHKQTTDLPGIYIKTFGCQMNEYDSAKLLHLLSEKYRPVNSPEEAALILVNTCSVRDKPEQKVYSLLGEIKNAVGSHQKKPMVGVGGCVAQQEGSEILKKSDGIVDFVFGTHNLSLVPSLVDKVMEGLGSQIAVDYREDWEDLPVGIYSDSLVSSFVSISRGCNKNCTYCIVPTTRGKEVSRNLDEIIREVNFVVRRGAKEVVLLGQTVNSYGLDLKPRIRFEELLNKVASIEGVKRIRFTSPHPQEIRSDFVELITNNEKICKHVHMPLQSGSNRILRLMNRNYRKERYLKIIEDLKTACSSQGFDLGITTDIIVGFPGETEEEFQETLEVMREVGFQNSYSFIFSKRPGTKAALMEDDLPLSVKKDRLQKLQELQGELTSTSLAGFIGKETEILVETVQHYSEWAKSDLSEKFDGYVLQGRNSQNILVNAKIHSSKLSGDVIQQEKGKFHTVKINECGRYTLRGDIILTENS